MFLNTISDGDNHDRRIDNWIIHRGEQTLQFDFLENRVPDKKNVPNFFLTLLGCTANSRPILYINRDEERVEARKKARLTGR